MHFQAAKALVSICLITYVIATIFTCAGTAVVGIKRQYRASDFFQDWWAEVTHGAKNGGLFSEMMGPSISN